MKGIFFAIILIHFCTTLAGQKTEIIYLSGMGKDNTVSWDFFCTKGLNSGKWTKINVPSNWEFQGFGTFRYGQDNEIADEEGIYKHSFMVPSTAKDKRIFIVFDGSMTDTEVKINGKLAGPVHQGAFYRFKYEITSLVKTGSENLLEARVSKESANKSVNRAERRSDYWIFGGIYRPVYLEIVPREFIRHIAIDAKANGEISVDVFPVGVKSNKEAAVQILTSDGAPVGNSFSAPVVKGDIRVNLKSVIPGPKLWSPEFPNLYQMKISLMESGVIVHQIIRKFGFRTIEIKENDGIYVNGTRVMFRGISRHSSWPTSGRCTDKELSISDLSLIKDMNINAVRLVSYPNDEHFVDACDSLGVFTLSEFAGWHGYYDTETGRKLIKEMVERDVNHPSVIMWVNGNEGGFNPEIRGEFAKNDIQKRIVIEPHSTINGINTNHYIPYNYGLSTFFNGRDIFFPTEFLHGLYDGGLGAGLDDYWNLMMSNPLSAGGFLWVFADEGIVRNDRNDSIDTFGNKAPDGLVGPFREKEASFYTVKEIWSPVFFPEKIITSSFNGNLEVSNRFLYTNLNQCRFNCDLVKFEGTFPFSGKETRSVKVIAPTTGPGEKGILKLNMPDNWKAYDVIYIKAFDPHGRHINTWSWKISSPEMIAERIVKEDGEPVICHEMEDMLTVTTGNTVVKFNKKNGLLAEVTQGGKIASVNNGGRFAGMRPVFREVKHYQSERSYVVEVFYENEKNSHLKWTILQGGWLRLEYYYRPDEYTDFAGITFSCSSGDITGADLLADGPYRVWKNRMKGTQFGLYNKQNNNTITGETWDYPEFRGYYSNFYAVQLNSKTLPVTIVSATSGLFLHLFTPEKPKFPAGSVTPPFPDGDISILHGISPIGSKFSNPEEMGPQSQKNVFTYRSPEPLKGVLYFRFGD